MALWIKIKNKKINMDNVVDFNIINNSDPDYDECWCIQFDMNSFADDISVDFDSKKEAEKVCTIIDRLINIIDIDKLIK